MGIQSNFYLLLGCILFSWRVGGDKYHEVTKKPTIQDTSEDKSYWNVVGQQELQDALNLVQNNNVAKNVILFLGDGMGMATVSAARIYDGQIRGELGEEGLLSFEKFPYVGLSKTYNVDFQVPDSAGTGTAYLTGVKTNRGVIGFDARVKRRLCETVTNDSFVDSIAKWSQEKSKRTGVVTTTRITHATPGSLYAHSPERDWECDSDIPSVSLQRCPFLKDIARQLVENEPGKLFNVIMGGGFQLLDGSATDQPGDPVSKSDCIRSDNRTLWQEWLTEKQSEGKAAAFVRNGTALGAIDLANTEYLMGIFANNHIPYGHDRREMKLDIPTLGQMTEAAITILSQEPNGFFLLVEGGRIDTSHHSTKARAALDETIEMSEAISRALELTNQEDTLIVVTADHSHTMTFNGYPVRGEDITGLAGFGLDNLPYTTLSYANGNGYNYTVIDGEAVRGDLTNTNTSSWDFTQQATVPRDSESHGGEDVPIYASGPLSHIFSSVHEENFIAHAMAYASCVGENLNHCSS